MRWIRSSSWRSSSATPTITRQGTSSALGARTLATTAPLPEYGHSVTNATAATATAAPTLSASPTAYSPARSRTPIITPRANRIVKRSHQGSLTRLNWRRIYLSRLTQTVRISYEPPLLTARRDGLPLRGGGRRVGVRRRHHRLANGARRAACVPPRAR